MKSIWRTVWTIWTFPISPWVRPSSSCLRFLFGNRSNSGRTLACSSWIGSRSNPCLYKTVEEDEAESGPERAAEVTAICSGTKRAAEQVQLRDGRHLGQEWGARSRLIEETGARGEGLIAWKFSDPETLARFVKRIEPDAERPNPEIVCERLLDGRTAINAHERRQLVLLFGTDAAAREELRRDVIDLQVIPDPQKRWDDRLLIERGNLFQALGRPLNSLPNILPSFPRTRTCRKPTARRITWRSGSAGECVHSSGLRGPKILRADHRSTG